MVGEKLCRGRGAYLKSFDSVCLKSLIVDKGRFWNHLKISKILNSGLVQDWTSVLTITFSYFHFTVAN